MSAAGPDPEGFAISRGGPLMPAGYNDIRSSASAVTAPLLTVAVLFSCCHLWRVGAINVTFSDTLFITVVFIELSLARLNGRPLGVLTPLWLLSLLLMLAGLFIGSFVNGDMTRWLIVAVQYLFSYMLLPMLLIRDRKTIERLILAFIIGVVAMESLGIATYYLVDGYEQAKALFGEDFITGGRRLGALAGDSNWNGIIIALTLPFVIYAGSKPLIPRAAALAAVLILMWALTLAASFTGFASAIIAMLVITIAGRLRPSPKLVLLGGLVAVGLFFSGYQPPEIFAKRVAPAFESGSLENAGTYDDRAELIKEAWALAEDTTLAGVGVDQYRKLSVFGQPVHNMYMLQLTEGGILALAGWLGLVLSLLLVPITHRRRSRLEAALGFSVMAVFLIFTMASPHMYARFLIVPVVLSLGAILTAPLLPLGNPLRRNRKGVTGQRY